MRLVLAANFSWVPKLVLEFHSSPQRGHSGFTVLTEELLQICFGFG